MTDYFTSAFIDTEGVMLAYLLTNTRDPMNVIRLRGVSRHFRRAIREISGKTWEDINSACWNFSWDLYNPLMTTTLKGFMASCHCWNTVNERVKVSERCGLQVAWQRDPDSGVQAARITLDSEHAKCKTTLAVPMSPKSRVWEEGKVSSSHLRLTRETLMFAQPLQDELANFSDDLSFDDSRDTSLNIALVFIMYRLVDKSDISRLCMCGEQCNTENLDLSDFDAFELIDIGRNFAAIKEEKCVLNFEGRGSLGFTNFIGYKMDKTRNQSLRKQILAYYMRYISESGGQFPDEQSVKYLQTVFMCMIRMSHMRKLIDEVYECTAEFRRSFGPQRWKSFSQDMPTRQQGQIINKWFINYSRQKNW